MLLLLNSDYGAMKNT